MPQLTGLQLPLDQMLQISIQIDGSVPASLVETIEERSRRGSSFDIQELFHSYQVNDLTGLLSSKGLSFTGAVGNRTLTWAEHNDVLGAYLPEKPAIKLYWVLIGMFASALQCSVEELTCVVLTHELSHAFTHLGQDLDGYQWDTDTFIRAELTTIEGLAQFYTELIVKKLQPSLPTIDRVFADLLQHQPQPYHKHKEWLKQGGQNTNEKLRLTMLACRRWLGADENYFNDYLSSLAELAIDGDIKE
jgi:hypothetical protein